MQSEELVIEKLNQTAGTASPSRGKAVIRVLLDHDGYSARPGSQPAPGPTAPPWAW